MGEINMHYGNIKKHDIANGTGVRVTLFVSGCRHHCKGCFNSETWDFNYGKPYTAQTQQEILEALKPGYIQGLTLLGGEPFEPENQAELTALLKKMRELYPQKDIWIYSGYTYEEITDPENPACHGENTDAMLSMADVLVDGKFHLQERDLTLKFRGSSNQRIIDVPATLESGKVVLNKLNFE